MRRLLKTHTDRRLARKVTVLRAACGCILVAWAAVIVAMASHGRFVVMTSRTGTKYGAPSIPHTVTWVDSPLAYVLQLAWHFLIGAALIGTAYVVVATLIERVHGRRGRFFSRRSRH